MRKRRHENVGKCIDDDDDDGLCVSGMNQISRKSMNAHKSFLEFVLNYFDFIRK